MSVAENEIRSGVTYATDQGIKYTVLQRGDMNAISLSHGWGSHPPGDGVYVRRENGPGRGNHRLIAIGAFCQMVTEIAKPPQGRAHLRREMPR